MSFRSSRLLINSAASREFERNSRVKRQREGRLRGVTVKVNWDRSLTRISRTERDEWGRKLGVVFREAIWKSSNENNWTWRGKEGGVGGASRGHRAREAG